MTRKLRKLWVKFSEAKGEVDGAWSEWAAEKEEMLDSVRMLQQQLTLKDLVIQAFVPPEDVQKVCFGVEGWMVFVGGMLGGVWIICFWGKGINRGGACGCKIVCLAVEIMTPVCDIGVDCICVQDGGV